jgi:hypothetical protein
LAGFLDFTTTGGGVEDVTCEAVLLKNFLYRFYALVPQHCTLVMAQDLASWCRTVRFKEQTVYQDFGCKAVVASTPDRDLMVVELTPNGGNPQQLAQVGLLLADYVPAKNTRLSIASRADFVDNCWIVGGPTASPYSDHEKPWIDLSARHNCSVKIERLEYRGYSGAPIMAEGTDILLGIPTTFAPDDFEERPALDVADSGFLALTADFVKTFRTKLVEAGLVFAKAEDQKVVVGDYLPSGLYQSSSAPDCNLLVMPLYTYTEIEGMKLSPCYQNGVPREWNVLECDEKRCKGGNVVLNISSNREFALKSGSMTHTYTYVDGTAGDQ